MDHHTHKYLWIAFFVVKIASGIARGHIHIVMVNASPELKVLKTKG